MLFSQSLISCPKSSMEVRRPHLFLTPVDVWRVPLVIFIHLIKDNTIWGIWRSNQIVTKPSMNGSVQLNIPVLISSQSLMEVRRSHLILTPVDVWRVPLVIFIHLLKDNPLVKKTTLNRKNWLTSCHALLIWNYLVQFDKLSKELD